MVIVSGVISLLCGVAMFLFGMSVMGNGLKHVAGEKLELILYKMTNTPIKGILLGTAVTMVIQSSSATTIMIIGFVNSGMMKVAQAIGVIMGANIGTSITGWILCLSYIGGSNGWAALLSTATISGIMAIIGIILYLFSKKDSLISLGEILLGFTVLMIGMQSMSAAVSPLKNSPQFLEIMSIVSNPVIGILAGIIFTAILQSASASIGVLQAISITGAISFSAAFPVTLGIGIGASVPVLLSSISANTDGKRTAFAYLTNDTLGMLICGSAFYIVNTVVGGMDIMNRIMSPVDIALLNTIYRVITVLILFPFIKLIEKFLEFIIKQKKVDEKKAADFALMEERFLDFPPIAIEHSYIMSEKMIKKAWESVQTSMMLMWNYDDKSSTLAKEKITTVDEYYSKLTKFLSNLIRKNLNEKQTVEITFLFHNIIEFKRISDHAANIVDIINEVYQKNIRYNKDDYFDLLKIDDDIAEVFDLTMECFRNHEKQMAYSIIDRCGKLNLVIKKNKNDYINNNRLNKGFDEIRYHNDYLSNVESMINSCEYIAHETIHREK